MKKKLSLKSVSVKSFVTEVGSKTSETVKGGIPAPQHSWKWCDPVSLNYYCQSMPNCWETELCPNSNNIDCNTVFVCDH